MGYAVVTAHPIAEDSPDHQHPWGNVRDAFSSGGLVAEFLLGGVKSVLDIGCAGGLFVQHLNENGIDAIGIDGSDAARQAAFCAWPSLGGEKLFTADATRRFDITKDGEAASFDIITSWECLEHLNPDRLDAFFSNVLMHLRGTFIGTINTDSGLANDGVEYHQCLMGKEKWHAAFARNGLRIIPYPFNSQLRPMPTSFLFAAVRA